MRKNVLNRHSDGSPAKVLLISEDADDAAMLRSMVYDRLDSKGQNEGPRVVFDGCSELQTKVEVCFTIKPV